MADWDQVTYAPGYDAAAWDTQLTQRHGGRRHSSRRGEGVGTWAGSTTANDWGPSSSSHGLIQLQRSRTIHVHSPQRDRNAAYYDSSTRQRTLSTTQAYGHSLSPYGYPLAYSHHTAFGWGNDDIDDEDVADQQHLSRRRHTINTGRTRAQRDGDGIGSNRGGDSGWASWQGQGSGYSDYKEAGGWNNAVRFLNIDGSDGRGFRRGRRTGDGSNNGNSPAWTSGEDGHTNGDAWWEQGSRTWGNDNGSGSIKVYRVRRGLERYPFNSIVKSGPIPVEEVPPGAIEQVVPQVRLGIKRLLGSIVGAADLHPFLRPAGLLKSQTFSWNMRHPPDPAQSGLPLGEAMGGFHEPAIKPSCELMRIKIPIPGLGGVYWVVEVTPKSQEELASPITPVTFFCPLTSFGRAHLKHHYSSKFDAASHIPYIRVSDVLMEVHRWLQQPAMYGDYEALTPLQRWKVDQEFRLRCSEIEGLDGRIKCHRQGLGTEEIDEEIQRKREEGLKNIDFMSGQTRWEGLDSDKDPDTWVVRLGSNNKHLVQNRGYFKHLQIRR